MAYKATELKNEHEEAIAAYCARNDLEFNQANAYDVTLEVFKDNPIKMEIEDKDTGEKQEKTITPRIARTIECQIRTVERIADKIERKKCEFRKSEWSKNIQKANIDSEPDIEKLVDNLYRLNIVDGASYLAFICFLMQLKYTREHEIFENDKTCVFFNGVARNGKSATAKAIYDIESQYGEVFIAKSGKVLESKHEERVWKSHLNYFDEVKPTDIDRELLLTIINGGDTELDPKNKRPYIHHVNTNNIFTSNDQISLKQRRVSVIKFGDRLNGRPLENGTLKKIITNIMDALPDFERYYDIYQIVSTDNENRVNPLAVESVITFMSSKLGFVNETEGRTLTAEITFAPHDIYNCIKNTYNKQIISSERQEAIRTVLKLWMEKGFLQEVKYEKGTTTNYQVTGANYLKIMTNYHKVNTKDEKNVKVPKCELYDILHPFFMEKNLAPEEYNKEPKPVMVTSNDLNNMNSSIMGFIDESVYKSLRNPDNYHRNVTDDVQNRGAYLFYSLLKHINEFLDGAKNADPSGAIFDNMDEVLEKYVTKDVCQYISCEGLIHMLKTEVMGFDDSYNEKVKALYFKNLGIRDEETFKMSEYHKASYFSHEVQDGMTIDDKWTYYSRKYREKLQQKKFNAAAQRQEKLKREEEHMRQCILSMNAEDKTSPAA